MIMANDRWVSALVIRGDGMTLVTQRLQVVGPHRPISQEPKVKIRERGARRQ